ncbi:MAG: ABC transporter ATP-binding protein [Chloroflexi bacterium]|nr:ABC transporter ATP-binding protein [Chloroflexota bacterium]MYC01713.1 ABC transporter ATP-binding protein [Chloroflexota bacterium]
MTTAEAASAQLAGIEQGARSPGSQVGRLVAPLRPTIAAACLLQAISSAFGVMPFIAVAEIGRVLLAEGPTDEGKAWLIAGLGVGAMLLQFIFKMASGAITHLADVDFQFYLRRNMAAQLSTVPLGWFNDRNAGAVKKALEDDVSTLHHIVGHSYTNIVGAMVTPVTALIYLFIIDWRMALVALIPIVGGVFLYAFMYRGFSEKMVAYDQALEDVNASSVAFVQGIAVVKTFGQARRSYRQFVEHANRFVDYFWQWVRGQIPWISAGNTVMSPIFAMVVILAIGLGMTASGAIEAIDLLPFIILGPSLAAAFLTLSFAQNDLMLAHRAADRVADVLDTPSLPESEKARVPVGTRVAFENVSFSYDGENEAVRGIDLTLEPGTVTALVGPSGSGKSTLARLLPRFWDTSEGRITIGGVPVDEISSNDLYRNVGLVFQDVQLLRMSIRDNIALSRPDALLDEVVAAAKTAQIHERILELPSGYDSVAGEDALLSGGEAQRVSIARAVLADAPILVLDEATAFADPEAEASIQDAISELIVGRTLLVIAHRLHTIVGADQICVLDRGQIIEQGTHDQLLALEGTYRRLWEASRVAEVVG